MTEQEAYKLYDDFLDEFNLDDLLPYYPPSRALKELEPTTYDNGFADWLDNEDIELDD